VVIEKNKVYGECISWGHEFGTDFFFFL
jgi:hypothetical protein